MSITAVAKLTGLQWVQLKLRDQACVHNGGGTFLSRSAIKHMHTTEAGHCYASSTIYGFASVLSRSAIRHVHTTEAGHCYASSTIYGFASVLSRSAIRHIRTTEAGVRS